MTHLSWYHYLRPLLFQLPEEMAHKLVLQALHYVPNACFKVPKSAPVDAMGIRFPNCVGLAAGLDKNGAHLDALAKLGFGFIEIGSVTPKPQAGNPKPRLFRIPEAQALINRMGFNNQGVHTAIANIRASRYQGILGINIGKNKDTSLTSAVEDYRYCMQVVYPYASYITVNISSPNTPDLRQLQYGDYFSELIAALMQEKNHLSQQYKKQVPLVVKLSPDESDETLKQMAAVLLQHKVDGIIATNTTCAREGVANLRHGQEAGGLSGSPLREKALHALVVIKQEAGDAITLIASGGIDTTAAAKERFDAGATLVQVYTGLIYQGPELVAQLGNVPFLTGASISSQHRFG